MHVSHWPVAFRHKCVVSIHILVICMNAFNHCTVQAAKYVNWGSIWVFWLRFFFYFVVSWVTSITREFIVQGCQLLRLYSINGSWMKYWYGSIGGMVWTGETEVLGEEPVSVPFYPPKFAHGLPWDQTWASVVGGQWLTD